MDKKIDWLGLKHSKKIKSNIKQISYECSIARKDNSYNTNSRIKQNIKIFYNEDLRVTEASHYSYSTR